MAYNAQDDSFHQEVQFRIVLSEPVAAGALNVAMKSVGMRLYYDVYAKPREKRGSVWQSETYANVDTFLNGVRSDAQEGSDLLVVSYPLATIDAAFIPKFADLLASLSDVLGGHMEHEGRIINPEGIDQILSEHATALMEEWGEEPGSKALRVLIETHR